MLECLKKPPVFPAWDTVKCNDRVVRIPQSRFREDRALRAVRGRTVPAFTRELRT